MYLFQKVCKYRTRLSLPGTQGEIITPASCVFVGDGIEQRVPLFPHHLDEPPIAQIVSHFFSALNGDVIDSHKKTLMMLDICSCNPTRERSAPWNSVCLVSAK